ncbi:MAG: IS256 family transposase [Alphaproteobacteria bacterium]|nr:IS256 family transposase [Alphaproteobacteria bacterium]
MALHWVMEAGVDALCGAGYGERSGDRRVQRNGYRQRPFGTRLGSVPLSIPRLRKGSCLPSFVSPRRRWERAFVNVVGEANVHGVSTRKVEALIEAMGAKGISNSELSSIAGELDEQVDAFRTRPLDGQTPYLWLDALYIKVRSRGRVVSKAVLVAYGVGETGQREVLGLEVADGEMETAWRAFLTGLVQRALFGVQLVVSDALSGLRAALRHVLNGTTWQRCTVHFLRNVPSHVPMAAQPLVSATVRTTLPAAHPARRPRCPPPRRPWAGRSICWTTSAPRSPSCCERPSTTSWPSCTSPTSTGARSCPPTHSSSSTRRSDAAPSSWRSSQASLRSSASWARCWPSRPTSGPSVDVAPAASG